MTATGMIRALPRPRLTIPWVFWVALAVVVVISLPNLRDPMIRHDDFPALLGLPELFWNKTLHEGRWLNYIWHLREVLTPAWLNFALYQICWAVFATAMAMVASPDRQPTLLAALMAAAILVAPSATLISTWFNTLQPGLAIVALYGVIVCCSSQRTTRAWLPVFTVATFMAYTTYPLLLLALCLAASRDRSLRDLAGLLALFAVSFVAAVLITYTLNWHVHGIFGVPLADWRAAAPAADLASFLANFDQLGTTLVMFLRRSSMASDGILLAHLTCLVLATVVIARRAPLEALYLYAGLATGLALISAQALKLGVVVPARAFIFFWVFYVVIFVRAVQLLNIRPGFAGRVGIAGVMLLVLTFGAQTFKRYAFFQTWQDETRLMAAQLADLPGPVHVIGRAMLSAAGRSADIQSEFALYFRLQQLGVATLYLCDDKDAPACSALDRTALPQDPVAGFEVTRVQGQTVLLITETPEPDA